MARGRPSLSWPPIALAACTVWAWAGSARACSCTSLSSDLATNLHDAKEAASVVFLGRLLRLDAPPSAGAHAGDSEATAVFELLESYKGHVGSQVPVTSGDGVSCAFRFREVGTQYLVYGSRGVLGESSLSASNCSRTRQVSEGDPELTWLRTGQLPPIPVAMRRELVECSSWCDLSDAARRLSGFKDEASSRLASGPAEARAAWESKKPFYGSQRYEEHRTVMLGRAADGRGFEIAEIAPSEDKCNRRLERRWCKDLFIDPVEKGAALHCRDPSQAEVLCDEARTRKARWGPLEEVKVDACVWEDAEETTCESELGPPKLRPAGSPSTPILICRPYRYFRAGDSFRCRVQASDVVE